MIHFFALTDIRTVSDLTYGHSLWPSGLAPGWVDNADRARLTSFSKNRTEKT